MRYYAVAVGRQQRVTSKYREFKYLIKNYPDAYYIVTEDYEKAEEFIKEYNSNLKKKPSHAYEENISYKPSFQTRYFNNTAVDNTIWISSQTKTAEPTNVFNQDFQVFVQNPRSYSSAISLSISTPAKLKLPEDKFISDLIENKEMNYYKKQWVYIDTLYNNHNQYLLMSLTEIFNILIKEGQDKVLICTDSHYLAQVLLRDMARRQHINTVPLMNLNEIILLYKAMSKFSKIFITKYNSKEKPTIHHKALNRNYELGKQLLEVKH